MKQLLSILFLIGSLTVWAQQPKTYTSTNKKAIMLYEQGEGLVNNRKFKEAIPVLQESIKKDPNFVEPYLKLGSVYRILMDLDNSKAYYIKGVQLKPDYKPFSGAYYQTAEYYFNDGDYANAKKYFEMTLRMNPNNKQWLEMSPKYLAKCDFAVELMQHPLDFKPVQMPAMVNQYFIHGYPVLTADQHTLIYTKRDGPRLDEDEDIVVSHTTNGLDWTQPEPLSPNLKSQFNEGACTMSADGKTVVFASCNRPDGLGACDLYISYKSGEEWSKPKNMGPKVNGGAWESEPAISADGRTLYFASERSGGMGKEDIWVTTLDDNNEWTQAVNVGKPINTEGREVSPFIHANGTTLFFSSTFHLGMGGFDIFSSEKTSTAWTEPKNIGYPINTASNDATLFISVDWKKGYYSIYEKADPRFNKAMLYEFELPKPLQADLTSTYASGKVYDAVTKKLIGAKIEIIDLSTGKVDQSVNADNVKGDYTIVLTEGKEYAMYISSTGYLFKSIFFDYKNPQAFNPLTLDVYLDPVKSGSSVVLNNIFFPSNSWQLDPKSKTELEKIALFIKMNPTVTIEFGGHTDDVGSDQANMDLSLKRAKAVYDYLIAQGAPAARMKYKGYGETRPLSPNSNDENRAKNRRIEFKVL